MARILIVDREIDWRQRLRHLLSVKGHDVTAVTNESDALSKLIENHFDLAIIDLQLCSDDGDDKNGLSLARVLKQLASRMNVIWLAGHPVPADQVIRLVRFLGLASVIAKPGLEGTSGVDLVTIVEKILGGQPGVDQLSLSFELGQPIVVRSRGVHVYAVRTAGVLQLSVPGYNRRAQEARGAPDPRFNVKVIGEDLYRDIFANYPEVLVTFRDARARSRPLCLSFEGRRDFIGIPFEFIFLDRPTEYLVLEHPVSRFINDVSPKRKALSLQTFTQLRGELRVLIVASNTEPPIPGVDQEVQQLADFLKQQGYVNVQVDLIPTEEATITRIRKELRSCKAHIFHYVGHGSYNELSPEESTLFFWSEGNCRRTIEIMSAAELKGLLQDTEVRLAYFSCCYGATTGSQPKLLDDDFLGIADAVIQSGVPSTLGFRWPVSDAGAIKLALAFYGSLLRQGSPEIALWEARRELAGLNRNDPTWLSPILIHQV